MGKVLFVSHTTNFIKFNLPFMQWLRGQGMEVHYASAEEEPFPQGVCDRHYQFPFQRSPYSLDNIKAYKGLKALIEQEKYDLIHCHTPVGGVVARMAARCARRRGAKVIYTAHGLHFFRGAPLRNWLLYYPVEWYLSRWTDLLITINEEDRRFAAKHFCCKVDKLDGVGVDLLRFHPPAEGEKANLRRKNHFQEDDFLLVYAGELNTNKNQGFLLDVMDELKDMPFIRLLLAGQGDREAFCRERIEQLHLGQRVVLLGYRNDMPEIYRMCDLCVASSIREGLGLNLVEGMASGMAAVVTDNRGHREVVAQGENGFLCPLGDVKQFAQAIRLLATDTALRHTLEGHARQCAQRYDVKLAVEHMGERYRQVCPELWR